MLEGQLSAANLLLAEVNMLPELGDGIQGSVVLETQAADLRWGEPEESQLNIQKKKKKCHLEDKYCIAQPFPFTPFYALS